MHLFPQTPHCLRVAVEQLRQALDVLRVRAVYPDPEVFFERLAEVERGRRDFGFRHGILLLLPEILGFFSFVCLDDFALCFLHQSPFQRVQV